MIAHEVRLIRVALQFLTRIPVGGIEGFEASWIERSAKYFPLIGALVGCVTALTLLVTSVVLPQPLPMLLGLAAAILITGALHEDGLADTADGLGASLGGGLTRERRLEIMKDSRIGTYGVVALIIVLALKAASLLALDPIMAGFVLIAAHAGGRLAAVVAMWALPYAGDAAAAKVGPLTTGVSAAELAVALVLGLAAGFTVLAPATFLAALATGLTAAGCVAVISRRRIGGITGDVLGAIEQVFETVFMIAAAAVIAGPG